MHWKDDPSYQTLEHMATAAGIPVYYVPVPDKADGATWARTEADRILMPDSGAAFQDAERACLALGREMARILSAAATPSKTMSQSKTEALYELIGVYLYQLAKMTHQKEGE